MKNMLLISLCLASFATFASETDPEKTTINQHLQVPEGWWSGEAEYYNHNGEICEKFFYAAELKGNTFFTLDPKTRKTANPNSEKHQNYTFKPGELEFKLGYDLKFTAHRITGDLSFNKENSKDNVWEFSGEERGRIFILRFIKISESELLIEAFANGKQHAKVHLGYRGYEDDQRWVGLNKMKYSLNYHWNSVQEALADLYLQNQ